MRKYKQTIIPKTVISEEVKTAKRSLLPKIAKKYYEDYLQNESVINEDKWFKISFSSAAKGKISRGSALYSKKVALLPILKDIIRVAEYSNFGLPKRNDPKELIGYLNFKAKCRIDGKIDYVHLACLMYSADKIFWNHEINIVKK